MAREMILRCNICRKQIEKVAGKIYLVPNVPGRKATYLSAYSASGDICTDCLKDLDGKLDRRKARANGKPSAKTKKRATHGRA